MSRFVFSAVLLSGMFLIGCGDNSDAPKLVAVEGVVTWKGKPLTDAGVAFTPEAGPVAIGRTDAQGHFSLSTQGRPGAMIGMHRVTIDAYENAPTGATNGIDSDRPAVPVSRIPAKFTDLANSGLASQVSESTGNNRFEFHLK